MSNPYAGLTGYELRHLPAHCVEVELWFELECLLTDLQFIEAKCMAGMTYELVGDYSAALGALPDIKSEHEEEYRHQQSLSLYIDETIAYAKARGKEKPLPEPPESLSVRSQTGHRFGTNATGETARADRLRAFDRFISANSHRLSEHPESSIVIAHNHADSEWMIEQAESIAKDITNPWIARKKRQHSQPASTGRVRTLQGHKSAVRCVAITPDGRLGISGDADTAIHVWNLSTGKLIGSLHGHTGIVTSAALSYCGRLAISASAIPHGFDKHLDREFRYSSLFDTTVRVWDIGAQTQRFCIESPHRAVHSVAMTPDGRTAVSAGENDMLCIWDIDTGQLVRVLYGPSYENVAREKRRAYGAEDFDRAAGDVTQVAISADGRVAVSAGRTGVIRWSLEESYDVRRLDSGRFMPNYVALALTLDARIALAVTKSGRLFRWYMEKEAEESFCVRRGCGDVYTAVFSQGAGTAVIAYKDGYLWRFQLDSELRSTVFCKSPPTVRALAVSADARYCVSAGDDRRLTMWDLAADTSAAVSQTGASFSTCLASTPDGSITVSGGQDGFICAWSASGSPAGTFVTRDRDSWRANELSCVAITPDGMMMVTGDSQGFLTVWKRSRWLGAKNYLRKLLPWLPKRKTQPAWREAFRFKAHEGWVTSVAIAADPKVVVSSSSWDRNVHVWRVGSFFVEPLGSIPNQYGGVSAMSLTPDDRFIVTVTVSGDSQVLRVWDRIRPAGMASVDDEEEEDDLAPLPINKRNSVHVGYMRRIRSIAVTHDRVVAANCGGFGEYIVGIWDLDTGVQLHTLIGHTDEVNCVSVDSKGGTIMSASDDCTVRVWDIMDGKQLAIEFFDSPVQCLSSLGTYGQFACGTSDGQVHFLTLRNRR